jgi:hypothetical protein
MGLPSPSEAEALSPWPARLVIVPQRLRPPTQEQEVPDPTVRFRGKANIRCFALHALSLAFAASEYRAPVSGRVRGSCLMAASSRLSPWRVRHSYWRTTTDLRGARRGDGPSAEESPTRCRGRACPTRSAAFRCAFDGRAKLSVYARPEGGCVRRLTEKASPGSAGILPAFNAGWKPALPAGAS